MSRAFPRNGMQRGPGGSGRPVDFVFDFQTDNKATRETAPMAITVVSIVWAKTQTYMASFTD